ncbi:10030_t:CDS:2 [Funneliformis geosporum]|nr:10030_t:CDS:2 [Funneliformis geosporum]
MSAQTLIGGVSRRNSYKNAFAFANVALRSFLRNKPTFDLRSELQHSRSITSVNRGYSTLNVLKNKRFSFDTRLSTGLNTSPQLFLIRTYAKLARTTKENITNNETETQVSNEEDASIINKDEYVPLRFDDISSMSENTKKALQKVFKYHEMSKVQDAVLSKLPIEGDLFVKAKTGTGKTLAFLIPAIETIIRNSQPEHRGEMVSVLIISPTRELAQQIANEANRLLSYYNYKVHCLVGGESKSAQVRKLSYQRVDFIVGTPGRLYDLLSSVPNFKKQCRGVKTLILDEADQLLDMGFREDIQDIVEYIPKERQTFLFSATVSPQIRQIAKMSLKPDYSFIDTVDANDVNTNLQVKQSYIITPYDSHLNAIRNVMKEHKTSHKNGKIIIFLSTRMGTMLYAEFLRNLGDLEVFELHSGLSQAQRSRVSERFRKSKNSTVLVTSDVSARGVDYPGVTMVLQVGAPSSREQYIHRLGRTGRAGREGEGVLILAPFEKGFIKLINNLPVKEVDGRSYIVKDDGMIERALEELDYDQIRSACAAFLGYYSGKTNTYLRKDNLLPAVNEFSQSFGQDIQLSPSFLDKFGIGQSRGGNRSGRNRADSFGGGRFDNNSFGRGRSDSKSFGKFNDDGGSRFKKRESRDRYKH